MSLPGHIDQLRKGLRQLRPMQLRIGWWPCPACGRRLQLRLRAGELGVRCAGCGASAVSQSIIGIIAMRCPDLARRTTLELSAHGAVARWLRDHAGATTLSEYMPEHPTGTVVDGVRNEDVQQLNFADESFDLVTSTEVFEHVADDARGFAQVRRVLRPGGCFIFTVPLTGAPCTHERAKLNGNEIVHLDMPEYHGDPFSGSTRVLSFRDYGEDILERLRTAGFDHACFMSPQLSMFGCARRVVIAERAV